jgi:uncharacterized RDD family membrane protein YckC
MVQRFDEIELQPVPPIEELPAVETLLDDSDAPLSHRLLALLTDLSLFVALSLALSPLLPAARNWPATLALGGFVVMISYYYFVGSWLLWGRTVGGTIFDVRVVSENDGAMSLKSASLRWLGIYIAFLTAGVGFAIAALPARRSLPDRISGTRCTRA